jgi:hypothetical protein
MKVHERKKLLQELLPLVARCEALTCRFCNNQRSGGLLTYEKSATTLTQKKGVVATTLAELLQPVAGIVARLIAEKNGRKNQ